MNPAVDFYFKEGKSWAKETALLRKTVLDCGLEEELKWGCPCYTLRGSNIVLIHDFKEYCALLFFKGALLNDAMNILIQQTKNVQSARQIRFTDLKEIEEQAKTLKAYIYEAIEVEKAGLKVKLKKTIDYDMPAEFLQVLKEKTGLKKAFEGLTPGRQRAYLLHFSSAKQAATRRARIEKCIPGIMKGKGLND